MVDIITFTNANNGRHYLIPPKEYNENTLEELAIIFHNTQPFIVEESIQAQDDRFVKWICKKHGFKNVTSNVTEVSNPLDV